VGVLRAVAESGGFELALTSHEAGASLYRKLGRVMTDETLGACRRAHGVLKGPVGDPAVRAPDGTEAGVLGGLAMRYTPSALDFDHPLDYHLVDGEHDLFGDGQVVLLPTYGHTPGHQSLLLRAGKGTELVLTADACYTRENMDRDILPTVLWDPAEMSRSLSALRDWRDKRGATVIYGHDAAQWQTMHRAPATLI
jgi:glyoxylase-like metal-dependent hydrolase (beta-lactamase superfamily II)